ISTACNNSGQVQVQTGTLSFTGGGTSSGQYTVTNGTVLSFSGGTHLLQSGAQVSGPGAMSVGGGTVNVQCPINVNSLTNSANLNFNEFATVYPTNVMFNGGTISGSNTVVTSFLGWNGGTFGAGSAPFTL